ncbi:MAG: hypothetical protein IJ227_05485 [Mogibacterium sp.]|nr:hypothetical protein [Mogibacterium sp.]
MKDILVLSHCILNNAAKVSQDESLLAEEYEQRKRLLELALDKGVQLLQLPCPEFTLYGSRRFGHVKDQFMHPRFIRESEEMLKPMFDQMEEYSSYPGDFRIIGVISVEGSPSCGSRLTCRADWKGEICSLPDEPVMANEPGVFMEIIIDGIGKRGLDIPVVTMEEAIGIMENLK